MRNFLSIIISMVFVLSFAENSLALKSLRRQAPAPVPAPYCGDGILQTTNNEQCDDGNNLSGDGCSTTCLNERCGDGVVQSSRGEQCDDGNNNRYDGCTNRCNFPACGDQICSYNETSFSCNQDCPSVCGNGLVEPGEECENSNIESCLVNGYPGLHACLGNCHYGSCSSSQFCGDTVCNGQETSASCVQDCPLPPQSSGGDLTNNCSDGSDNDQDGLLDTADPDCHKFNFSEIPPNQIVDGKYMDWYVLNRNPVSGSREVYVSSSTGNDNNNGLSPASAKRTLAAGYALLRNNSTDSLLLKRGDVWVNENIVNTKSGISPAQPLTFATYGNVSDPRPRLEVTGSGFSNGNTPNVNNVNVDGIELYAYRRDPSNLNYTTDPSSGTPASGFDLRGPARDWVIQDVLIRFFRMGMTLQGTADVVPHNLVNVKVNKSAIFDSYGRTGMTAPTTNYHSSAAYTTELDGGEFTGCFFDQNGWNPTVASAAKTIFNHTLYLAAHSGGTLAKGNIISNSSSNGIQGRAGGNFENNFVVRNGIGILAVTGGSVRRNVVMDARDIGSTASGVGIEIENIKEDGPGLVVDSNIVAHDGTTPTNSYAFDASGLNCADNQSLDGSCEINNLSLLSNIVFGWNRPLILRGADMQLHNVQVFNNEFQNPTIGGPIVLHTSYFNAGEVTLGSNIYYNNNSNNTQNPNQRFSLNGQLMGPGPWANATGDDSLLEQLQYPDPNRSVENYMGSLGLTPTYEAFIQRVREQRRGNWDDRFTAPAVNDYIRAGFGR